MRRFEKLNPEAPAVFHFPQRRVIIRRKGASLQSMAAVFPGYIFVEAEEDDLPALQWILRRSAGFMRFLGSGSGARALSGRDLELVLHFVKKVGPVAEVSRVSFDENMRILVADGPLKGLEGRIIKVDKRKKRAKIRLDLYDDSFAIDLAFEIIDAL